MSHTLEFIEFWGPYTDIVSSHGSWAHASAKPSEKLSTYNINFFKTHVTGFLSILKDHQIHTSPCSMRTFE